MVGRDLVPLTHCLPLFDQSPPQNSMWQKRGVRFLVSLTPFLFSDLIEGRKIGHREFLLPRRKPRGTSWLFLEKQGRYGGRWVGRLSARQAARSANRDKAGFASVIE